MVQPEARWVFKICDIIYINGIVELGEGGIFRTGDVWERNISKLPRSCDISLWIELIFITKWMIDMFTMHVWDNQKLEKYSRYTNVIHINGIHMLWRGTFQNRGCLRTQYAVLRLLLFSQCTSINRVVIDYQMDVKLIDLFGMHVSDNPKLEKYSRYVIQFISMGYIY